MSYVELTDLQGEIPGDFLIQALDDNNDGEIDAWTLVQRQACEEVDGLLEGRFAVPLTLSPLPRVVKQAAIAFACELCYRRRGKPDAENPFKSRANDFRKRLMAVTEGELKLSVAPNADAAAVDPPGSVIIFDSGLGTPGRILG